MDYENIVADVKACLDLYKWPYSDDSIRKTVDRWLKAKKGLLEVLRKHPQWNEEAMAVVFDYDTVREINEAKYRNARTSLNYEYAHSGNADNSQLEEYARITNPAYVCRQFVDDVARDHFKKFGINAAEGTKISRILGRYFRSKGIDKTENYNRYFADLSDAINPISVTRYSLLSVHPCDYLNMSNGTGWRSCHSIDNGEYMAGTLSYMGDQCTMILYTVDRSYTGESRYFWKEPKINRQVYAYGKNVLLQSRLYPNCGDKESRTNFRNAVQKIVADALGVPNYWTISTGWEDSIEKVVKTHRQSMHYKDYIHDEYNASVSLLKGAEHGTLHIGSLARCVDCALRYKAVQRSTAVGDTDVLNVAST